MNCYSEKTLIKNLENLTFNSYKAKDNKNYKKIRDKYKRFKDMNFSSQIKLSSNSIKLFDERISEISIALTPSSLYEIVDEGDQEKSTDKSDEFFKKRKIISFVLDKMRTYTKYFPHNNVDLVLQKFSHPVKEEQFHQIKRRPSLRFAWSKKSSLKTLSSASNLDDYIPPSLNQDFSKKELLKTE